MIQHRTKSEVRRFDSFKLIVTLVLLAVLVWQLLAARNANRTSEITAEATTVPVPTAVVEEAPAQEAEIVDTAAEGPEIIVVPRFQLPEGELEPGELTLAGTGAPDTIVEVLVDGAVVGSTVVDSDGNWSLPVTVSYGSVFVSAQSLDAAGEITAISDPTRLNFRLPPLPSFALPADLVSGETTWSGAAEPGSIVELLVNGEVIGQVTTDADGSWSLPVALAAGDYQINSRLLDADGNIIIESEAMAVSVAPVMPTFNLPDMAAGSLSSLSGTGEPGSDVDVLVNGAVVGTAVIGADGNWLFDYELGAGDYEIALETTDANGRVLAVEPVTLTVAATVPTIASPVGGADLDSGEIAFSGTGAPESEVEIVDNGAVVGTAVVSADGTWTFPFTPDAGEHEFVVRVVGSDTGSEPIRTTVSPAETAPAETTTFACGEGRPGIDQGDTYIVGDCDWLGKIAQQTGVDARDLIAANPQIEDPNLIFPEQVLNMPPR